MSIGYFRMTVTPYNFGRAGVEMRLDMEVNGKTYGCVERLLEPYFKSYFRLILERVTEEMERTILKESPHA